MYSYLSAMGATVSLLFFLRTTEARVHSNAALLTCLFLGICAIATAVELIQEMKRESSCNVYDLLRFVVSVVFFILVSIGCFE